nr:MAG TPA: hypothetical protein [Caudoviricetes sp.]
MPLASMSGFSFCFQFLSLAKKVGSSRKLIYELPWSFYFAKKWRKLSLIKRE